MEKNGHKEIHTVKVYIDCRPKELQPAQPDSGCSVIQYIQFNVDALNQETCVISTNPRELI